MCDNTKESETDDCRNIFNLLICEFEDVTDHLWVDIRRKCNPRDIADELLGKLSGIPEPTGRLFDEMVQREIQNTWSSQTKKGA